MRRVEAGITVYSENGRKRKKDRKFFKKLNQENEVQGKKISSR